MSPVRSLYKSSFIWAAWMTSELIPLRMPGPLAFTALPGTLASAASADRLAASFVDRVLFSAFELDNAVVNSVIFCCSDEMVDSWFSIFFSSFVPSLAAVVWAASSAFSSAISSLDAVTRPY